MKYIENLVSVVIPTYRRSDLLFRAIESVLEQTYSDIECIVVNDNEKGDEYSLELYKNIEKYTTNPKFRFVEQEKHINGAVAMNYGISMAKGEYLAFLDDDDFWEKEKLELQVALLKTLDESWGAVSCLNRRFSNGVLKITTLPFKAGNIHLDVLSRRIGLGTGSVLIRREALDDVGYFDETLIRHQDLQLFARLTSKYKVGLVKKYLHNIETADAQNRPSVDKIIAIKKAYFDSIADIMENLTKRERKWVYTMHDFESAFVFFKEGRKKEAFKKAIGIFGSFKTLYWSLERVVLRVIGKKFAKKLNKKYSINA